MDARSQFSIANVLAANVAVTNATVAYYVAADVTVTDAAVADDVASDVTVEDTTVAHTVAADVAVADATVADDVTADVIVAEATIDTANVVDGTIVDVPGTTTSSLITLALERSTLPDVLRTVPDQARIVIHNQRFGVIPTGYIVHLVTCTLSRHSFEALILTPGVQYIIPQPLTFLPRFPANQFPISHPPTSHHITPQYNRTTRYPHNRTSLHDVSKRLIKRPPSNPYHSLGVFRSSGVLVSFKPTCRELAKVSLHARLGSVEVPPKLFVDPVHHIQWCRF